LLPSLAPALNWISNILCEDTAAAAIVLKAIVKQPEASDSQVIHQTILAMFAPQLGKQIKSIQSPEDRFNSVTKILNQSSEFSFAMEQVIPTEQSQLLDELQHGIVTLITSSGTGDFEEPSKCHNIPSMVNSVVDARGVEVTLRALIGVLLQLSAEP